ncbi:hypothetical protein PIB30_083883 [Stylosanthes scabra]|uniref:Disease resistance protein At3g14460 n=1 Tax=Stylosanthes scabra TaxID=79078 RepID=A0ABU6YSZ8_9FABA|nr:hypothetical protein [Stylosanthes scabra]
MAEDLLRSPKRGETFEEVGCECFDELASRLFFKQVGDGDEKYFVMHDLMHDLATFLAGKFYCRISELGEKEEMSILTRHLLYNNLKKPIPVLRYLDLSWSTFEVLPQSVCNLCNLQTLKLRSCSLLTMLPSSLGELIQLFYLDLSESAIKTLPESLCKLSYLQTLKLEDCSDLTMLPNGMYNLLNLRHLDIRGTALKEMPKGMGKLEQLQVLSYYVVGKQEDNGILELGGLLNLHGSIAIQKLENVADVNQARSPRIIDKKHIDNLLLEWSSGDDMVSDIQIEGDVLDSLRPHIGLKELRIEGYKGKIFADWLGQYSYNNMTSVSLKSCKNCHKLPSLGQLPSLKSLRIECFDQLMCIGDEFYKNEGDHTLHIAPFPSLETLKFEDMACWEVWKLPGSEAFPQLKKLEISGCPMLKGDTVSQIFMRIASSSSDVSKVRKLYMMENEASVNDAGMLLDGDSLSLKGFESLVESAFKARIIHHLTSLQEIIIIGCLSAVSFPANCLPKSLQKLEIQNCKKLEFLEQQQQQQHKYDLVELEIYASCDSLASLSLDAFPNLKNLQIERCENLESISMSEPPHTALQRLVIYGCSKLVSLAEEGLSAPNLTSLDVVYCDKLEALPCNMDTLLQNLQSLDIQGCRGISRFPEGGLPPNLKKLGMSVYEEQLRGLSSIGKLEGLTHLGIIGWECESITIPKVGLLPHLPSLTTLIFQGFPKLETLECNELLRLTSLQHLKIFSCRKLKNIAGEKLPSSLLLLEIKGCPQLEDSCKYMHQHIWPKVSHIPSIEGDGVHIVM